MLLGGSNTGVSLALSAAAKEKKVPFFAIGAAGASLTGKDCTPYTIPFSSHSPLCSFNFERFPRLRGWAVRSGRPVL
jgi:hypothetical protein